MHDALRQRIIRRLEALPEAQLYQVLDYIEFLESRYNRGIPDDAGGFQKLAEQLEDGLRKRAFNPSNLREAFQVIAAADRVLSSVSEAGKEILAEIQRTEPPAARGAGAPEARRVSAAPAEPSPPSTEDVTGPEGKDPRG